MFPNRQCIVLGLPHKIHIKLLQAVSNPAVLHETTVTHHAISGTDTPHQHIGHVGALNLTVSPCLCYTLCNALTRLRICRGAFRSDDLVVLTATFVTHRHAGVKLRSPCVPQSDGLPRTGPGCSLSMPAICWWQASVSYPSLWPVEVVRGHQASTGYSLPTEQLATHG